MSLRGVLCTGGCLAWLNADEHIGRYPWALRVDWTPALAPAHTALVATGLRGLPLSRAWL